MDWVILIAVVLAWGARDIAEVKRVNLILKRLHEIEEKVNNNQSRLLQRMAEIHERLGKTNARLKDLKREVNR